MPFSINSDNAGVVSPAGQVALPSYIPPVAAPTAAPTPGYTQAQVDASIAANPNASKGGYEGVGTIDHPGPEGQTSYGTSQPQGVAPPAGVQTSPFDSDPGYADATAREQLGLPAIDTNLKNLMSQRIVAFGDPSLAAQAGFGLDPQAAAFARQNYLSGNGELARLDKSHDQARRAIINALAAHGLLDSGDTGYQTGQADQVYGNSVYDAQQSALADILGYRNQAQQQRDSLHAAKMTALENAYGYAMDHPGDYATDSSTATTDSTAVSGNAGTEGDAQMVALGKRIAAAARPRRTALRNPYTTGQKRFG